MLDRERSYFEENLEKWLKEFPGHFVLVHGAALIGAFASQEEALTEGARLFGLEPFLVRRVEHDRGPVYVPAKLVSVCRDPSRSITPG